MSKNPSIQSVPTSKTNLSLVDATSRLRGLPERENLFELAQTYLSLQHKHWPELVGTPILPEVNDPNLAAMISEFVSAYQSSQVNTSGDFTATQTSGIGIGAAYVRYSDANSNTRSLDQQLLNALQTARREKVFIPWQFVFADAAISGTTQARNGYQMLRSLVESADTIISCIFVDDLDRLNRDQIESLLFMRLLDHHRIRVITANGFDSSQQMSKVAHTIKALQNEQFVDQLKEKVIRGMKDVAHLGKNLGKPPTGYKIIPIVDSSGQIRINRKGKCETEVAIDEEAAAVVRRIFTMFTDQKISPRVIGQILCQESALGRQGWGASTVGNVLRNERYIGIYIWGKRRTDKHPITGKRKDVLRPMEEWLRIDIPELRIIDDELWQATQKRLAEVSRNTRPKNPSKRSRQSVYPTRLFDLYCRYCDKPLWLNRAGRYSHLCCLHGKEGTHNCELRTCKSLSIIDDCILAFIAEKVLDDASVDSLIEQANAFLTEEAAKPKADTVELRQQIQKQKSFIKRQAERLMTLGDGIAAETLIQAIATAECEVERLEAELAIADSANFRPEIIDRAAIAELMINLRELLHTDVISAHQILAKALGKVYITQGPKRKRYHSWIAELNINPIPVFLEIAMKRDCPTAPSLDYLQKRSWTIATPIWADIDKRGVHHEFKQDFPAFTANIKSP